MPLYTRIKLDCLLHKYHYKVFIYEMIFFGKIFLKNQPYQNKFFRLLYSKLTQQVAAFHALVPKLSQKLLNSCTFPLSQYPKSETPKIEYSIHCPLPYSLLGTRYYEMDNSSRFYSSRLFQDAP